METVPNSMSETEPTEEEVRTCAERVLNILQGTYELELNNFEKLRLWSYAKEAIERSKKNIVAGVKVWSLDYPEPIMETLELFLSREFGLREDEIHKIYELDLPGHVIWQYKNKVQAEDAYRTLKEKGHRVGVSRTSKVPEDFKQYLKILQERNRRGEP